MQTKTQDELDQISRGPSEDRAQRRDRSTGYQPLAGSGAGEGRRGDFEKIRDPLWREGAAVQMVDNARQWPGYRQAPRLNPAMSRKPWRPGSGAIRTK
ncbi:MAG: hypothetical protein IPI20_19855 [Rhodoferax sp.]|nr:hypothetical protein [Rhodoferax sp.]